MSWLVTGWAKGTSRSGEPQAARISLMFTEFNVNDVLDVERQASGLYRREYQTWAAQIGGYAVDGVTGERKELPPGRIIDEHDGSYEVNDEVTTTRPK